MPQTILGQTREQWTAQAAKALRASMDPLLLHAVLEKGFWPFAYAARRTFRAAEPGIVFDLAELRAMFDYLERHRPSPEVLQVCRQNALLQSQYEQQAE